MPHNKANQMPTHFLQMLRIYHKNGYNAEDEIVINLGFPSQNKIKQ